MKGNSVKYLLKQGVKNLWLNRMMTLASVGVLTACLLIVGFAVLLTENINNMVGYMESQNEMVAFMYTQDDYNEVLEAKGQSAMDNDAWNAFIEETHQQVESVANVQEVTYVSKEEGLEQQKEQWGEKGALLDDYQGDENPLPESFVIKIEDLEKLTETRDALADLEGIETVRAADSVASTLTDLRRIVNVVGWSIVIALVVVSLVIVMNTIRATIFNRRKELNIMKYVGATNNFIRLPFVVEGVCLGLISALISYILIWVGYTYILNSFLGGTSAWLQSAFESIIPFKDIALKLAGFFFLSSVGIGTLGSIVSIRNHIKV